MTGLDEFKRAPDMASISSDVLVGGARRASSEMAVADVCPSLEVISAQDSSSVVITRPKHLIKETNGDDNENDDDDEDDVDADEQRLLQDPCWTKEEEALILKLEAECVDPEGRRALSNRRSQEKKTTKKEKTEKWLSCEVCKKSFSHLSYLTAHIRTHTGEKPYKCLLCPKSYTHSGSLSVHARLHTGQRPFQCPVCPKAFAEKTVLNKHVVAHSGLKAFQCDTCGKSFTERSHLVRHQRVHTGERPFACVICGKSFSQKVVLTKHIRWHEKKEIAADATTS